MSKVKEASGLIKAKTEPYFTMAQEWLNDYITAMDNPEIASMKMKKQIIKDNLKIIKTAMKRMEKTKIIHGMSTFLMKANSYEKMYEHDVGMGHYSRKSFKDVGVDLGFFLKNSIQTASINALTEVVSHQKIANFSSIEEKRKFARSHVLNCLKRDINPRQNRINWAEMANFDYIAFAGFEKTAFLAHKNWSSHFLDLFINNMDSFKIAKPS